MNEPLSRECQRCHGSGYEGSGHVMNDDAENDGVKEHICRVCPVPCRDCGGIGVETAEVIADRMFRQAFGHGP